MPLLLKDRCIGVFDLESPELDAFNKTRRRDSHAARQPSGGRDRERAALRGDQGQRGPHREGAAVCAARAGGAAAGGAAEAPARRGRRGALRARPRARRRSARLSVARANSLVVAVGRRLGKGVPAALYSAFAGELVRRRTFRRRYTPERATPAGVLASVNSILHERSLEEYYCTLCYVFFDFKRRVVMLANSGLPYPDPLPGRHLRADRAARHAARLVCRVDVRRSVVRVECRGFVRAVLGRCLRGVRRARARVRRRAAARCRARASH